MTVITRADAFDAADLATAVRPLGGSDAALGFRAPRRWSSTTTTFESVAPMLASSPWQSDFGITEIATLDRRHFSVVRPRHVEAFRLLPE